MKPSDKAGIRAVMRDRLKALGAETRAAASRQLRERLRQLPAFQNAARVLLFAPLPDEPDLWPLVKVALEAGKEVALPVFVAATGVYGARRLADPDRDVVAGRFGVREPAAGCTEVPLATLDLVVLPGLAFTADGSRLGRGGGFYDRLLAATWAVRCGVGRDEQILAGLPSEPHDVKLDYVLTPSATYMCRRAPV